MRLLLTSFGLNLASGMLDVDGSKEALISRLGEAKRQKTKFK
jgi:hypothetical protein